MNTFLQNLLLVNLSIAVVIAAFILMRRLLKNKMHTKILCLLWIVIFVRMLIPIPIESNLGMVENDAVQNVYVQAENYITNNNYTSNSADSETVNTAEDTTETENISQNNNVVYNMTARSINISVYIYILGAAAAALYILISNIAFIKKIRHDRIKMILSNADRQVFADQGISSLKVYLVEGLHSPCLLGLIRPRILLNSKSAHNANIRRYSLYHESTHYKHKDNFILLIGLIACIINWFNPMMWLALSFSKKDREVLCDEHVVKKIGEQEAIDYGKSLLYVAQNNPSRLLSLPTTMTGGKEEMKQRIKNLAYNYKRLIVISILVVLAVVSLLVVTGIFKPKETSIDIAPTQVIVSETAPKEMPQIVCDGLQIIDNVYDYPEYGEYFDSVLDDENFYVFGIYITDIDNDGTCELYADSAESGTNHSWKIIECYDLKTDTYSKTIAPKGMGYYIKEFEDKMYLLAIYDNDMDVEQKNHAYEPYLREGELHYKEIDPTLETKIIEFWAFTSFNDPNAQFLLDISIYDITQDDVFIRSFSQESAEATDEMMTLFGCIENDDNQDLAHTYKAIISFEYGDREQPMTLLFGGPEYLTAVFDATKANFINDELREFLLALAKGDYSENGS